MGGIGGLSGYGGYGDGQHKEKFSEDDGRNQGEARVLGRQDDATLKFPRCAKVWANWPIGLFISENWQCDIDCSVPAVCWSKAWSNEKMSSKVGSLTWSKLQRVKR